MDITRWLEGLEQYEQAFRKGDVGAEVLPELTADYLSAVGVTSVGHRRKLLAAIASLRPASQSAPDLAAARAATMSLARRAVAGAERRQVTVMFCDLVGSTALSFQLDPEDLREVIAAYHSCVAQTIARYDGFVAKYMGDGVLVYFGYPQAHEDDAERAVRAGLALVAAAAEIATIHCKLSLRIGIGTGIVVIGDLIGEGSAQEQAIVGDTPNLAARLQALAEPNTVVIGRRTRRLLGDLFQYRDLGPLKLKGAVEPARAYQVLHQSAIESRFEALHSARLAPLVGREQEIKLLLRCWQRAKSGNGQVVLLSGEPGIGKSRIASTLLEKTQTEPQTRSRYFCSPYHQESALYPFIIQLERAAGLERHDTAEQKLGKLNRLLAAGARSNDEITLLAELLSLPNSSADLKLSPRRKREMLFEALLHQLEAVAQSQPVLLVFEDAHWIDPTSRELLDLTLDRVSQLPVFVVITFRPEFDHAWSGRRHVTALMLDRLGERDGAALVEWFAGDASLCREIVDEIVERADGVPLFVEELTKAVLESGSRGDRVTAVLRRNPLPNLTIPPTLQASLLARLDRLGPIAREVAQVGAVLGREFSYALIRQVAGRGDTELRAALDHLTQSGLVSYRETGPAGSYLFKHALVRDTAYGTLLRGRRRELNARVAAVIVERFPQLAQSQPELVAHYYTEGDHKEQAAEYWYQAGQQANARFAMREAVAHFTKGLELLAALPDGEARDRRELELQLALVVSLVAMHGFGSEKVEVCAKRAKDLSDRCGDAHSRFAAYRFVWNSCLLRRPLAQTVALARTLMDLAREDNHPARLAIAHRALGRSTHIAGMQTDADELLATGATLADSVADAEFTAYSEHPGIICRAYRGQLRCLRGFLDDAARLAETAVERARTVYSPFILAWSLIIAAQTHLFRRDACTAERAAREAIALSREHRLPQWMAFGQQCLGRVLCQQGDWRGGIELQREAMDSLHAAGSLLHTTRLRLHLAESFLAIGDVDQTRLHLNAAFGHLQTHGEAHLASEIHLVKLKLLKAEGAPYEALNPPIQMGLDIARRQGAHLLELRLASWIAGMWRDLGMPQEARDLLAPVYSWFTEGFDTPDLKEAKALLDELK
jgi:class 3 adenylate cyclase